VIGESPTGQWFDDGFQTIVDPDHWECIWIAHHYTNLWANPSDVGWTTAFDPYPGPAHTCTTNSTTPDRVIFVAAQWTETTTAEVQADLQAIVANINKVFKNPKRIEMMALTSAPVGTPCPYVGTTGNETIIPPVVYDAIANMPAANPGLVFALPHFTVVTCTDFIFNAATGDTQPQYTNAGGADVGLHVFGPYYLANP